MTDDPPLEVVARVANRRMKYGHLVWVSGSDVQLWIARGDIELP